MDRMTYLSRRMYEIHEEDRRRKEQDVDGVKWTWPEWASMDALKHSYEHKRAEFLAGWPWGRGA
jgi:hypothetical protein